MNSFNFNNRPKLTPEQQLERIRNMHKDLLALQDRKAMQDSNANAGMLACLNQLNIGVIVP